MTTLLVCSLYFFRKVSRADAERKRSKDRLAGQDFPLLPWWAWSALTAAEALCFLPCPSRCLSRDIGRPISFASQEY